MYEDYDDYYDYYEPPDLYEDPWESYNAGSDAFDCYDEPEYYKEEYDDCSLIDEERAGNAYYENLYREALERGDIGKKPAGLDLGVFDIIITIIPPMMLVRMLADVIACLCQRRPIREGRYIQFITRTDGIDWSSVNGS